MDEPLIWNTLEDAASWLSANTGRAWTAKQVLSTAITIAQRHKGGWTHMKAIMPRNTSFGTYKFVIEKGAGTYPYVRERGAKWTSVPLSLFNLHELLVHDETRAGPVQTPDDGGKEDEYVLIEPIEDEHIISSKMAGISGRDLKHLLAFVVGKDKRLTNKEERPLGTTERATLLTIIAALAKEVGVPISRPSKAADLIADMTQRLGSPVSKRSIEEKLKLINDAVESRAKS